MSAEDVVILMPTDLRREEATEPILASENELLGHVGSPTPKLKPRSIVKFTVETPPSQSESTGFQRATETRPPARWKTPEFIFYGLVYAITIPVMVWIPVQLSQASHPNYKLYERRLSPGWIFGRKVDNSDAQYRSFRSNIPALLLLCGAFFILKFTYSRIVLRTSSPPPSSLLYRIPYLVAFSILMLLGLHGTSAFKVLAILAVNYGIAKGCGSSKLSPILTWVFNMAVLFANERNDGHRFGSISPALAYLDSVQGFYPRWHISFNITMLRLVSFNMDYFWASRNAGPADTGHALSHKQRTGIAHPADVYSFANYIAYVLYPPLYIAGPIMTFNDFMWQHRRPTTIPSLSYVAKYLIRFIACLLTMELVLHYMYVVAIKDAVAWQGDSAFELSMIGFFNLLIVWLKLLLPWRFFRLWALADGMDPPENMIRCMVNNYSTLGFWRSWHRSYNLWIVRYIYIPLGGTRNAVFTTVLVFSFVALWHDLSFHLLAWGWLVSLFIIPEITARYVLPPSKYGDKPWYRHLCALGGVGNNLMMLTANLIGFVVGVDGMWYMLHQIFGTFEGLRFLLIACFCIFVGIQVMFEYREEEMRQGIYRKC